MGSLAVGVGSHAVVVGSHAVGVGSHALVLGSKSLCYYYFSSTGIPHTHCSHANNILP